MNNMREMNEKRELG